MAHQTAANSLDDSLHNEWRRIQQAMKLAPANAYARDGVVDPEAAKHAVFVAEMDQLPVRIREQLLEQYPLFNTLWNQCHSDHGRKPCTV